MRSAMWWSLVVLLCLSVSPACRADTVTFAFSGDPNYYSYGAYPAIPPDYDPIKVTTLNFSFETPADGSTDSFSTYSAASTGFGYIADFLPGGTTQFTYTYSAVWEVDFFSPNSSNADTDLVISFHNYFSDVLADSIGFSGPQLFTGPVTSPTLVPGTYTLVENNRYGSSNAGPLASITITAATPEPSSLLLLVTGVCALCLVPWGRTLVGSSR